MEGKLLYLLKEINIYPNVVFIILGLFVLLYYKSYAGYVLMGLGIILQLIETIFIDLLKYKIKEESNEKD